MGRLPPPQRSMAPLRCASRWFTVGGDRSSSRGLLSLTGHVPLESMLHLLIHVSSPACGPLAKVEWQTEGEVWRQPARGLAWDENNHCRELTSAQALADASW